MKKVLSRLSALRAAISILRNPDDTENVFKLIHALQQDPDLKERFGPTPEIQAFTQDAFYQDFPSLQSLRELPERTLGYELSLHMDKLGVDFSQFDRAHDLEADHERLGRHLEETHDIWHVVTGAGTDVSGEVGLQAFYMAQLNGIPPLVIMTLGMMRLMVDGATAVVPTMDAMTRGWTLGRSSQPLVGCDWRPWLGRPLDEVREHFGVQTQDRPWRDALAAAA